MNLDKLKEASFYCLKNTIRNLSFPSNHITIHLCLIGNLSFLLVDVNYAVFILFCQAEGRIASTLLAEHYLPLHHTLLHFGSYPTKADSDF